MPTVRGPVRAHRRGWRPAFLLRGRALRAEEVAVTTAEMLRAAEVTTFEPAPPFDV